MTEEQAVEYITQRFLDRWPVELSTVPYGINGEPEVSQDAFVSLAIQMTTRKQITQGTHPRYLQNGRIWVRAWTPAIAVGGATGGTKAPAQIADAARRVFERQQLGTPLVETLQVGAGETQTGGVNARWMLSAIVFGFYFAYQS